MHVVCKGVDGTETAHGSQIDCLYLNARVTSSKDFRWSDAATRTRREELRNTIVRIK
jgi:hypothetical protein